MRDDKRTAVVLSVLSVCVYVILYHLRAFDDNRLTSWDLAFKSVSASRAFLIFVSGAVLSFFLSRLEFPSGRRAVFLFLVSYCVVIPFWSEPEVIVDASRYFTQAKHLARYGTGFFLKEWGTGISAWTDMPLIPFLYGLIFKVFGESRVCIQAFNTALFSGSVVLTYLTGRLLWDDETGFVGGLLLLGVPYLITQPPLMLVDVPTMFFFLLSVFTFLVALERGGWTVFPAAAALVLAFFSKYSVWLMLSVLGVIAAVYFVREQAGRGDETLLPAGRPGTILTRSAAVAAIAGVAIGSIFIAKSSVFLSQMKLLMDYQRPGLRRWGESDFSTFFFQTNPLIPVFAVCSAYIAAKKRDLRFLIAAWLVMVVLVMRIRRIRYIVMVFPMLTLMASYGLVKMGRGRFARPAVACIAAFSLGLALFAFLPFLRKISTVNLVDAGAFLDGLGRGDVIVCTLLPDQPVMDPAVSVPLLDISTKRDVRYVYDADAYRQPREKIATSPLRFTWEYKNPEYYRISADRRSSVPLVVIANSLEEPLPEDVEQEAMKYRRRKVFSTSEGIFVFQTVVTVYYD